MPVEDADPVAVAHIDSARADTRVDASSSLDAMASWIVNLVVAGTAVGIGAIGTRLLGETAKPKPIPVRVRKERRR